MARANILPTLLTDSISIDSSTIDDHTRQEPDCDLIIISTFTELHLSQQIGALQGCDTLEEILLEYDPSEMILPGFTPFGGIFSDLDGYRLQDFYIPICICGNDS